MKGFYVYGVYDVNNVIRYIGKGSGSRLLNSVKQNHNRIFKNINVKNFKSSVLFDNLTESEAYEKEKELIQKYGRVITNTGTLFNITEGGNGAYGVMNSKSITLKNIKTGEIFTFQSHKKAAEFLKCDVSYIGSLAKGKYKHIKRTFVLPETNNIKPVKIIRSKSFLLKRYKPIKLYDNIKKEYLQFTSQKAVSVKLNVSTGDVTVLKKNIIKSIKSGRYSMLPLKKWRSKSF